MRAKLLVPVEDTDSLEFKYNGEDFTDEEYADMIMDYYHKNSSKVNAYMTKGIRESSYYNNDIYEIENRDEIYDKTVDVEVDCNVLDSEWYDVDEAFLEDKIINSKMFVLILDIPLRYDNIEDNDLMYQFQNAESELKYWIQDSMMVWGNRSYDKRTKLQLSPTHDFKIILQNDRIYKLKDCKVFENYTENNNGIKFAMLVSKIK